MIPPQAPVNPFAVYNHLPEIPEPGSALVRFAFTNIISYLGDTENLSVIRASSSEIDAFLSGLPALLTPSQKVVYARASEALLYIPGPNAGAAAEDLKIAVCRAVADSSSVSNATVAAAVLPWRADITVQGGLAELEGILRRAQMSQATVVPPRPDRGGTRECALDGLRPADASEHVAGRGNLQISNHARRRLVAGRRLRLGILEYLTAELDDWDAGDNWDQTFDGLGRFGSSELTSGKMAVLHIDGNRFRACRSRLTSLRGVAAFADIVDQSMREALKDATWSLLQAAPARKALPLHVLYRAGDECLLVVPAAWGPRIALGMLENFSAHVSAHLGSLEAELRTELAGAMFDGTLTISVGMVVCDLHEPIMAASARAEELCDGAKRLLRDPRQAHDAKTGNVTDFQIFESIALPPDIGTWRKQYYAAAWPAKSARKLRGPLRRDDFDQLCNDIAGLKRIGPPAGSAEFPKTRMHELVRLLRQVGGRTLDEARASLSEEAWSVFAKLDEQVRKELTAALPHLLPPDKTACTWDQLVPWMGRRELWDYVD